MTTEGPSLAALTKKYRRAKDALNTARTELAAAVRAEYAAGMRQADIVRAIDHEWSGEHVRGVLKKAPEQQEPTAPQRGAGRRRVRD
jgi:hypothetical protein